MRRARMLAGEIMATDEREAFNGLLPAVVRARRGETGTITLTAESEGLKKGVSQITVERWPPRGEE